MATHTFQSGKYTMGSANDMKAAKTTYESFIGMLKWSVPLIAVIAAVVVILIAD
ncbi:MAG: aa3-type cytochrome c oxidase subunit IV [Alteripontixanthobacter sp.]